MFGISVLVFIKQIYNSLNQVTISFNDLELVITTIPPKTIISNYQFSNEKELFDHFDIPENSYISTYGDNNHYIKISTIEQNKIVNVAACFVKEIYSNFNNQNSTSNYSNIGSDKSFTIFFKSNSINSVRRKKYKMIVIYCLYVYPKFRNKQISNFLLEFVESKFSYDIFALAVNPKSKFNTVNFYNYFKRNFNFINFVESNPPEIFTNTFEDYLNSICIDFEMLKTFCKKILLPENENKKYVVLSKFKERSNLRSNDIRKEDLFELARVFFDNFKEKMKK